MPQMFPMNWMILCFLLWPIILSMYTHNYFFYAKLKNKKKMVSMTKNCYLNLKW